MPSSCTVTVPSAINVDVLNERLLSGKAQAILNVEFWVASTSAIKPGASVNKEMPERRPTIVDRFCGFVPEHSQRLEKQDVISQYLQTTSWTRDRYPHVNPCAKDQQRSVLIKSLLRMPAVGRVRTFAAQTAS